MNDPSQLVSSLTGKCPWSARVGVGSFLVFDFGRRLALPDGAMIGEWSLWIRCAPWRIRTENRLLLGSEDDREILKTQIGQLTGSTVAHSMLVLPTMDLIIEFESGARLETFSIEGTNYEHWTLNYPESMTMTAGPGFSIRYGRADESPERQKRIQI